MLGISDRDQTIGKTAVQIEHPDLQQALTALNDEVNQTSYQETTSAEGQRLLLAIAPSYTGSDIGHLSNWIVIMRDMATALGSGNELSPIAHDLIDQMATVNRLVSQLTAVGDLSTDQKDLTTQITRINQSMASVVANLALLENIRSRKVSKETIDLKELIQEILGNFQAEATQRNLTLKDMTADTLSPLQANREQHRTALYHLVDTAVKYSPTGAKIIILTKEEEGNHSIAIRDTGMGIWPKDIPFVFERFFRVQSPQVQATPGQRLGLAVVKAIAEAHEGRVWVESRVGQGSIFFFQIPA